MNTITAVINRIGAEPFIGAIVGLPRAAISMITALAILIIGVLGTLFMCFMSYCYDKHYWNLNFFDKLLAVFVLSIKHYFIGLAEIFPGVGAYVHYRID